MKKRYLITNLVYDDLYLRIFIERHLRSLLDDTNLPAISKDYEIEYRIFTDKKTEPKLKDHPMIKRLAAFATVNVQVFDWHSAAQPFNDRYSCLYQTFLESVQYAMGGTDSKPPFDYVTAWVADLVVARDFFPRIMKRMEEGHDAVFVLPLRAAFESTSQAFGQVNRALTDFELFRLGFNHLHGLWLACHWGEPSFTRMPYTLLWKSKTGLMARSFSVTPIIFKPNTDLLKSNGGIDVDVPQHFENPYWCEDWTDAPVIGVEPLFCHHPQFHHEGCSVGFVKRWAYRKKDAPIHPSQSVLMKKRLYYPDRKTANISWWKKLKSDFITWRIT